MPAPGGVLEEQTSPPCKVVDTIKPQSVNQIRSGVAVYDLGQNIAGWAQLRVSGGVAGAEIVLRYGERLKDNGEVDQSNIHVFVKSGDCQTDRYIMKGENEEVWEPRFTYHGFRYVQAEGLPGTPTLDHIRGRVVRTAFDEIGSFECSLKDVNSLQRLTKWSYIGNFVGIPTDCPHREKNGWTGDAQLAAETGLMNYDAASSYMQWLDTMADTQRPSGQLPGIVPSAGWGYNWGSGPAWDAAFVLIPWYIYLYTGDARAIETHYDGIRRYLDFGILGAKYVPRALADNGHVELAYRMITQPEFPGWVNWLQQGLTTLRESWNDTTSGNHIMFGDISAWFYNYLAGINPDPANPGFKHVILKPRPVSDLERVHATHRSRFGLLEVAWEKKGGSIRYSIDIPAGAVASFSPPGQSPRQLEAGHHETTFETIA